MTPASANVATPPFTKAKYSAWRRPSGIADSFTLLFPRHRQLGTVALAIALALFVLALLRTAWVCDDAYITFRTVDNLLHGYGARWNPAERVQTYTHPLWMIVLAACGLVQSQPYWNALAASVACSVGTAAIVAFRLSASRWQAVAALLLLTASKAFVEYSTSGLENPLSHLWIVCALGALAAPPARRPWISLLLASLAVVTRQDLAWLLGPVVLWYLRRTPSARTARALAIGAAPLVAWESASLIYYGFLAPNTAFAKLTTGIAERELVHQGLWYLQESWWHDPITLATIGLSIVAGLTSRDGRALAAGQCVYVGYVVWIGGDFMSGRFLTAPFVAGVAALASKRIVVEGAWPAALSIGVLLAGSFLATRTVLTDGHFGEHQGYEEFHGITDERQYYYRRTGLLRADHAFEVPRLSEAAVTGVMHAAGQTVATRDAVGMFGFSAGPSLHVVDVLALGDPLLARLPAMRPWRIGHFRRALPPGYIQTLRGGQNVIADPGVAAYYEDLRLVTRADLWSSARWRAIVRMNLRLDEQLLDRYKEAQHDF